MRGHTHRPCPQGAYTLVGDTSQEIKGHVMALYNLVDDTSQEIKKVEWWAGHQATQTHKGGRDELSEIKWAMLKKKTLCRSTWQTLCPLWKKGIFLFYLKRSQSSIQ